MRTCFPLFYTVSANRHYPFWNYPCSPTHQTYGDIVIDHLSRELELSAGDINQMTAKTAAFAQDVINQKAMHPRLTPLLDYIQFAGCSIVLSNFANNKYFNLSFHWILNSLSDEISTEDPERSYYPERLLNFTKSSYPFVRKTLDQVMPGWLQDTFYYSRHSGGGKELAGFCVEGELFEWLILRGKKTKSLEYVKALSQMCTWCFNFHYEKQNYKLQITMYEIYEAATNPDVRKLIAFHFSCLPDNKTGRGRQEWAEIVTTNHSHRLVGHESFQLMANRWEDDVDTTKAHFDEIIQALKKYTANQQPYHGSLFNHVRSTLFTILDRMVVNLMMHGCVGMVNRIYGAYFGIPDDELIDPQNLIIIPALDQGIMYVLEGTTETIAYDGNEMLNLILSLHNRFAGVRFTRHDQMDFVPEVPGRQGVPDWRQASNYLKGLMSMLRIRNVSTLKGVETMNGYYLRLGLQLPIQGIISVETGVTLPIIHSFRKPLTPRPIKCVCIWQGFTNMAETERLGLEEIFAGAGYMTVWLDCFQSSKQEFIDHYSNGRYDLVWILGHGEFSHDDAHIAFLELGNEIQISIDELLTISLQHTDRRLLVIDACDGANSALANNPAAIGIGVSVVAANQSVMSHQWPVENAPSLTIGLLLASYLIADITYEQAHHSAIIKFQEGKAAVTEHLEKLIQNQEVLDRIRNTELDFSNFCYWGSLSLII